MPEFLVHQRTLWPADPEKNAMREELREQERKRAMELRDAGILVRLWRLPGTRDSVGLYRTEDVDELHDVLASLPMFPWMDIRIHPLATHPQERPAPES